MRPKRARYVVISFLIIAVFVLIWFRMYELQILAYDDYRVQADSKTTKTLTLTGKRGTIYDVNLIPLAYDRPSFNVQFYRDPSRTSEADRREYTESIYKTIQLVEANGKKIIEGFWLEQDDNGAWRFNTGAEPGSSTDRKRQEQWRKNFYLESTPEGDLFESLCVNYCVDKDWTMEEKIKVLTIWQQQRMYNFLSIPVTIAEDVGFETVSEVEVRTSELMGMSVQQSSVRVYPKGSVASHVIGYTSKISGEEAMENYREKGYAIDATVGQTGIEYSMEDRLTPNIKMRQGQRVVEINNRGKIIREISFQPPIDGDDIILTIDSRLQSVMQAALAKNIADIRKGQEDLRDTSLWRRVNREKLLEYEKTNRQLQLANSGAMVAMDPNNGRILGMVSYPDFDLSHFGGGVVDSKYWNELIADERNPMYNRAISTRDTPGSIFKMVTALASLMDGELTLDRRISDGGLFTDTGDKSRQPKCWVSSGKRYTHANQTIVEAIKNSCNFFFYTVGLETGIDNIVKWGARLGLTSRTAIELPNESTSFIGNQKMMFDEDRPIDTRNQYTAKPYIAAREIKKAMRRVGIDRGIEYDEDRLNKVAKMFLDIVAEDGLKDTWPAKIRTILLEEMNIPSEYIRNHFLVNEVYYCINDLRWTQSETVMAAIGQSITAITPVAAARYVSAICNGGTVFNAQIIDRIVSPTGTVVLKKEPMIVDEIAGAEQYFAAINAGMREVTQGENDGTAAQAFTNAKYKIAAKTGTAQRTNIDLENNSWLVTYAPADDPKIVVVVYVQNGYAGVKSARAAIKTIEYYLDNLKKVDSLTVPVSNAMAN